MQNRLNAVKHLTALLGLLATLTVAGQSFAAKQPPAQPIDINSAGVEQLTQIPGIGPAKAQAIVAYRAKAPFASTQELVNVDGIGDKLYAKIAPFVAVNGKASATAPAQVTGTAVKPSH